MPLPGRLRFFPVAHLAGLFFLLLILLTTAFWPEPTPGNLQQTRLVIDIPQKPNHNNDPDIQRPWSEATVKTGDNLSSLFSRFQLSPVDILDLLAVAPGDSLTLRPGQTIRWRASSDKRIQNLQIPVSALAKHYFERNAEGNFDYELQQRNADHRPRYASAVINNSLFMDGAAAGIPEQILIELAAIFGWDIDFALDIRQGDQFSLIYEEIFLDGKKIGNGNILIARFHNRGRELTAIRYKDKRGNANYFTPKGLNMRKEFLRNPIDFARISSRFNLRRKHPVLNRIRAHKGTDYAAPTGTPIKAAGDGKVILAGRKGGFGNCVIIQHGSRYQTLYAHLSKFGRRVRRGRSVKQGQIIGYVGSTGLATGPHLHYEFRVDGVHRDSLRVKLPKARSISAWQKADFTRKANSMLMWLNSYNPEHDRSSTTKGKKAS